MMAYQHTRNDSGVSVHSTVVRPDPPSPTLTNPDMILPHQPWQHEPSPRHPHPLLEPELPLPQTETQSFLSHKPTEYYPRSETNGATSITAVQALSAHDATTLDTPGTPTAPSFPSYSHGSPLSNIYEESEVPTPTSRPKRRSASTTPTPAQERAESPSKPENTKRLSTQKKRISSMSSSSAGSDVGDWETFDASKALSGRVAADLAQMKRQDSLDVEESDSKRMSREEEEELSALNAKTELILENARKRLTHMSDNLKTARDSVIIPARSPQIGEHKPAGGLYRSISAAGATKFGRKPLGPQLRITPSLQHMRGASETGLSSTTRHAPKVLDVRSASAMDYSPSTRHNAFADMSQSFTTRVQPSPSSSRSYNTPLKTLTEEEKQSPSTAETTPEHSKAPVPRGLGIHAAAALSRENLASTLEQSPSQQPPMPLYLTRSMSSTSTRSARELREQMTDLKSRIADLKSKAQADNLRRRSIQSTRSSSPFRSDQNPDGTPASESRDITSKMSTRSPTSSTHPQTNGHLAGVDDRRDRALSPITPMNQKFLDVDNLTPNAERRLLSSARTDRNTPTLARTKESEQPEDHTRAAAPPQEEHENDNDDGNFDDDHDELDVGVVAENMEEQIYLNEVLEESLRDAEVEPEVPLIPGAFLEPVTDVEAERHEDRIDAFDYENMFLHSAMGTYTGKSLNGSEDGSDSEGDADSEDSAETSRADTKTPVQQQYSQRKEEDDEDEDSAEADTDDEMERVITGDSDESTQYPASSSEGQVSPILAKPFQLRSPARMNLPTPTKPWNKKSRSNSMESSSTAMTFETATEGNGRYNDDDDGDNEHPVEILNWNGQTAQQRVSPAIRNFSGPNSPLRAVTISKPGQPSPVYHTSPKSPRQPTRTYDRTFPSPGLGLGVIGAENAQYIADDGIPERFRGQPSPSHSRQSSQQTVQVVNNNKKGKRASSRATISSPISTGVSGSGHARNFSTNTTLARTPTTQTKETDPVSVRLADSPQRKVVVNRSFQHAESFIARPHTPPTVPLPPPPPSSQILQQKLASPRLVRPEQQLLSQREQPLAAQTQTIPSPSASTTTTNSIPSTQPAQDGQTRSKPTAPVPNTEILMESLIKLADPHFSLTPGTRFAEIDKELVLGLLRSVGGVCNSVLLADAHARGSSGGDDRSREQAGRAVGFLRGRLDGARRVLNGEIRVEEQMDGDHD